MAFPRGIAAPRTRYGFSPASASASRLRQSLIMSNGNWVIFLQRPISLTLLVVCGALLALAALSLIRSRRDWRSRLAEVETGENP